jgi:hypothetical protein
VKRRKHCEWQNKVYFLPNNLIQRTAYREDTAALDVENINTKSIPPKAVFLTAKGTISDF